MFRRIRQMATPEAKLCLRFQTCRCYFDCWCSSFCLGVLDDVNFMLLVLCIFRSNKTINSICLIDWFQIYVTSSGYLAQCPPCGTKLRAQLWRDSVPSASVMHGAMWETVKLCVSLWDIDEVLSLSVKGWDRSGLTGDWVSLWCLDGSFVGWCC